MDYLYALQCVREAGPEFINYIFLFISEFFFMGGIVFSTYIYWCIDKSAGSAILVGYGSSVFVNQIIKNVACVYRPWIRDARLHVDPIAKGSATGYSFPSGHTVSAASVFGGISAWQRKRKWVVVLMSLVILLVAFSRNWLGAHTMKDVVVAIIVAAVMLSICSLVRYFLIRHPTKDTILCFSAIAISLIVLLLLNIKEYPIDVGSDGLVLVDPYNMKTDCFTSSGVMCGIFLGMWLERHFLQFEVSKDKTERLKTIFFGAILVFIVYLSFGYIFSFLGEHWCHFVKYFGIFFTIFYIYPLIFTYVRRRRI